MTSGGAQEKKTFLFTPVYSQFYAVKMDLEVVTKKQSFGTYIMLQAKLAELFN